MSKTITRDQMQPLSVDAALRSIPTIQLNWSLADQQGIEIWVSRTDQLHEHFGGNKFFKMFYHLEEFRKSPYKKILSFGGAFSNHIYALAGVGHALNIPTIGVIRGERPKQLSPTLVDAQNLGMELHFINRQDYKNKNSKNILDALRNVHGEVYIIPEGGDDELGSLGCQAWGKSLAQQCSITPDAVCMAVGTGGTVSGFCASGWLTEFHGYLVLKGTEAEYREMEEKIISRSQMLLNSSLAKFTQAHKPKLVLHTNAHCGGYAKPSADLLQFIQEFEEETSVPLDPVYTGKVMFALSRQIKQNYWPKGTKLLFIHTGGIQGKRGLQHRGYQ